VEAFVDAARQQAQRSGWRDLAHRDATTGTARAAALAELAAQVAFGATCYAPILSDP
jgi:hypothetical protein